MTVVPKEPKYPLHTLATWELRDYRKKLETALANSLDDPAERQIIKEQLLAVVVEQNQRVGHPEPAGRSSEE